MKLILIRHGPIFKKRIELLEMDKIPKGDYWFLNIKNYMFSDKDRGGGK